MVTLREADVLRLLAGGRTYGQIGEQIGIDDPGLADQRPGHR